MARKRISKPNRKYCYKTQGETINMNKLKIPIVIPAYEPDNSLLYLCNELINNSIDDIIIIDDGSGTTYRSIFETLKCKYKCTIITHAVNLGKGRALKTAFNYILNHKDKYLGCITADSDGQHTVKDIIECMKALRDNPMSLILGCRDFSGNHIPFKSSFGNNLTKKIFSFLCGIQISDTQTGLRGIPIDFMTELMNTPGERFEFETNMLIQVKNKLNIIEVPIETIYDSKDNHKTHFNPIKDSIKIYKIFGKMFFKYIFSSLSSFVLDIVLFAFFCSILRGKINFTYITISTILARVISASYNYLLNYKFVFNSNQDHKKSSWKYIILAITQMCISAVLVTVLMISFKFNSETNIKIIIDTILFFLSYYIQRKYIF